MVWNRLFKLWQPLTDSGISKNSTTRKPNLPHPFSYFSSSNNNAGPYTATAYSPFYANSTTPSATTCNNNHNNDDSNFILYENTNCSLIGANNTTFPTHNSSNDSSANPKQGHCQSYTPVQTTPSPPSFVTVISKNSESPNKVHPRQENRPAPFSGGMNRRGSMKKMSWLLRGDFQPLPQDDVDYDTDNNQTEEDLLLDPSDDDCSFDHRYRGEHNFGRSRSSSGSLRERSCGTRDTTVSPTLPGGGGDLESSKANPFNFGKGQSHFDRSKRDERGGSGGFGVSSGTGGAVGCSSGASGGTGSTSNEPKKGRVIATPWGAAWIGKRKKGVTYCFPDRKRQSLRATEDKSAAVSKKSAEGYNPGSRNEDKSLGPDDVFRFEDESIACVVDDGLDDDDDDDDWGMAEHICDPSCPLLPHGDCMDLHSPCLSSLSGQRRSSFTSSTSKDSTLSSLTGHARRPRPLASLNIDESTGAGCSAAMKSPGLLSTGSLWSISDLRQGAKATDTDGASHGGTNSLSNVSGSFNERMHELVRAFSSRTQRTKEKISQPPTPSTDSEDDAASALSVADEAPRANRLGSFLPMGSGTSDAFSEGNQDHFVGVWHCKFKTPKFFKRLRFPTTIEPHSKIYVAWLFIVTLAFMYNACVIPLRGVFPYQTSDNVRYWLIADYVCDFIYLIDMIIFKMRLRFANNGIAECDRNETKKHYMAKWMFKFDILSLTPLDLLYFIDGVGVNPWLRLCRLLKIQTFWEFYEKCDQAASSSAHAIRIVKTMTYMLFLIHIETCGYYAVSQYEGIGTNQWVYNGKGIAYIRCFYLATKTATSIGNNPKPINELEYGFMTLYWLSGVFVFALLIGQIRDIVEAAGMVKDNYRKKMDACLWYMQSINMPNEMQERVRAWFLYNWDQQKTIDERSLVSSLPRKLQTDLAINVHYQTLSKVQLFQDCEKNLLLDLVLKLKPILFLPGDYICKKGEVGKEMYIVTQGQVEVVGGENNTTVLATLYEGSVFGEISLLAMSGRGNRRTADVRSKGFTNVFTLSKHDFEEAMTEYPDAQSMLKRRAKKLLKANAKMEKKNKTVGAEEIIKTPSDTPKLLRTVIQVMDPDSNVVKQLGSSLKRSRYSHRRPVSRSHSHRLSPSQSNVHHLTPPRSHSYRLATKTSSHSLSTLAAGGTSPLILSQKPPEGVVDSDDQDEELAFDDSSEDLSLSEVFRDAATISSFEDDEEGDDQTDSGDDDNLNRFDDEEEDELLRIEQYEEDSRNDRTPSRSSPGSHSSSSSSSSPSSSTSSSSPPSSSMSKACVTPDLQRNESRKSRLETLVGESNPDDDRSEERHDEKGGDKKEKDGDAEEHGPDERLRRNSLMIGQLDERGVDDREDRRSERSKGESTIPSEDSQDSGLPDVQRSDSRSSSGKKEPGQDSDSRRGSKTNSRTSRRGSGASDGSDDKDAPGTSGYGRNNNAHIPDDDSFEVQDKNKGKFDFSDSLENYIEKQVVFPRKTSEEKGSIGEIAKLPVQTSAGPSVQVLVMSEITGSPKCNSGVTEVKSKVSSPTRVRKMSVVSPPLSPAEMKSPKEMIEPSGHLWASAGSRSQVSSNLRGNGSNAMRSFTPVETIQIRPLPPIEGSPLSMTSPNVFHRLSSTRSTSPISALTNGLEGCCGGGPLVEIPPENRVTCSVEIHGQKGGSSITTTRDIHGHTETKL